MTTKIWQDYLESVIKKEFKHHTEYHKELCRRYCRLQIKNWPIERCIGLFMIKFNARYSDKTLSVIFSNPCINYYYYV